MAPNKFLAKIASGYRKPDGLTVIPPERVESFLQELPVEALWGVGPVTAKKLRAVGIEKLVQVRSVDLELLRADRRQPGGLAAPALARRRSARRWCPTASRSPRSTENTYAEDLVELEAIRAELDRMARENAEWLARRKPRRRAP